MAQLGSVSSHAKQTQKAGCNPVRQTPGLRPTDPGLSTNPKGDVTARSGAGAGRGCLEERDVDRRPGRLP